MTEDIEADAAARDEELCALEAIFGEIVNVSREESIVEVCLPHPHGGPQEVVLRASLPPEYPSTACPMAELYGRHLSDDVLSWAAKQLETMFSPGEVVLYNWVEWLRDQEEMLWSGAPPPPASQGKGSEDAEGGGEGGGGGGAAAVAGKAGDSGPREQEALELLRVLRVTSGEPYTEKKSTFQAHVAPVSSFDDVRAVMDALLSLSKVRAATHNIMAYRLYNPGAVAGGGGGADGGGGGAGGGGSFLQDYDDDGETAAGGRLLRLLQAADVRNAVVVVSRWFGGVLMGPQRFTAINNTARTLLEQLGYVAGAGGQGQGGRGAVGGPAGAGHGGKRHGR